MSPKDQNERPRDGLTLPRWAVPIAWALIVPVIHLLLPWVIAKIGPRIGWVGRSPSSQNNLGLLAVGLGLSLYVWCLANHFRTYREPVRVGFSPPHLVVSGPYRISRNPMYVSGLLAWLGWAVYYGSPAVLISLFLLWGLFSSRVIPHEENLLEELFGEEYLAYKRTVRRWIGRY